MWGEKRKERRLERKKTECDVAHLKKRQIFDFTRLQPHTDAEISH